MRAEWNKLWDGREVAVLCSGPSLCEEDVALVAHLPRIVTNTTFRLAPDADFLFGFDTAWWAAHAAEVNTSFRGRRVSYHFGAAKYGAMAMEREPGFRSYGNSGACAIALAALLGARRILLLGADCAIGAKTHWHGDHPKALSNAKSHAVWPRQFQYAGAFARTLRAEVINCSRETKLTCFPRVPLSEALCPATA